MKSEQGSIDNKLALVTKSLSTLSGASGRLKSAADDIGDQYAPVRAGSAQNYHQSLQAQPKAEMLMAKGTFGSAMENRQYAVDGYSSIARKDTASGFIGQERKRPEVYSQVVNMPVPTTAEQNITYEPYYQKTTTPTGAALLERNESMDRTLSYMPQQYYPVSIPVSTDTEEYKTIQENGFLSAVDNPLSTLSADVDTASYSNVRRYLSQHQMPPRDAVRIEELINYFSYDYPQPWMFQPFSITTDLAGCPWNPGHQLLRVGLKGKIPAGFTLPPSNLVFLIDVSGSMADADKLPLLKEGFKMMVQQLRPQDYVSIVVYSGSAGQVLAPTSGSNKYSIINAIDSLQAGGSTAGGEGLRLAYEIAKQSFIRGGNNRVILATDGDFNVGVSNTADLTRMIEEERRSGISLTVLGFGQGNIKDGRMGSLADNGNGNYFYIDNLQEAQKVLVNELGSTLFTIAKDVKIQIEFNPAAVKAYRLIGYEKRVLAKEDFNNDRKDAGEIGAGHAVTALYEIVPEGCWSKFESTPGVDPLKYQRKVTVIYPRVSPNEVLTVKLRYKDPDGDTSKLITRTVKKSEFTHYPTGDFAWASAVAEFGMLLRGSEYRGNSSYEQALNLAHNNTGNDPNGLRAEFLNLVEIARNIDPQPQPQPVWMNNNNYENDYPGQTGGQINFK